MKKYAVELTLQWSYEVEAESEDEAESDARTMWETGHMVERPEVTFIEEI